MKKSDDSSNFINRVGIIRVVQRDVRRRSSKYVDNPDLRYIYWFWRLGVKAMKTEFQLKVTTLFCQRHVLWVNKRWCFFCCWAISKRYSLYHILLQAVKSWVECQYSFPFRVVHPFTSELSGPCYRRCEGVRAQEGCWAAPGPWLTAWGKNGVTPKLSDALLPLLPVHTVRNR